MSHSDHEGVPVQVTTTKRSIFALLAVLLTAGCGGMGLEEPEAESVETSAQIQQEAVRVTPKFQLEGTEQIPQNLYLTELGLTVFEIRLEPTFGAENGVAYTNREPIRLRYDVAEGEIEKRGSQLVLPDSGTYRVSVKLKPVTPKASSGPPFSFMMAGLISDGRRIVPLDSNWDGKVYGGGEPIPLPFDGVDEEEEDSRAVEAEATENSSSREKWMPFQYTSDDSVYYTIGEVDLVKGKQDLEFRFEVNDWAEDVVDPLMEVLDSEVTSGAEPKKTVDVTDKIDRAAYASQAVQVVMKYMSVDAKLNSDM